MDAALAEASAWRRAKPEHQRRNRALASIDHTEARAVTSLGAAAVVAFVGDSAMRRHS